MVRFMSWYEAGNKIGKGGKESLVMAMKTNTTLTELHYS